MITQETLAATLRAAGKRLSICDATWSSSDCEFFELTEFPDMTAVQKRIDFYEQAEKFRYYEISTILGSDLEQTCNDAEQAAKLTSQLDPSIGNWVFASYFHLL